MTGEPDFQLGVIEGFFGRPWRWADRKSYADFLRRQGLGFYIYAPKADQHLRKRWTEPWPAADAGRLAELAEDYRSAGLSFGLGFSPFEVYLSEPETQRAALRRKVTELNLINPDILSIQFDDMSGAIADLAQRQARTVADITEFSNARRFIVCPTYYSYDPRLETLFGAMPKNYLAELGRLIDPKIALFWTGPRIFSESYPADHLLEVTEKFRRKPFLWDNYPVNDSAKTSNFLHLRPFTGRPAKLNTLLSGHAVNPMNQAWLSQIAIRSLSDSYQAGARYDPEKSFQEACRSLCGEAMGRQLSKHLDLFQGKGLSALDDAMRAALIRIYRRYQQNPYATEVVDWLEGAYGFDPNCLSD